MSFVKSKHKLRTFWYVYSNPRRQSLIIIKDNCVDQHDPRSIYLQMRRLNYRRSSSILLSSSTLLMPLRAARYILRDGWQTKPQMLETTT